MNTILRRNAAGEATIVIPEAMLQVIGNWRDGDELELTLYGEFPTHIVIRFASRPARADGSRRVYIEGVLQPEAGTG